MFVVYLPYMELIAAAAELPDTNYQAEVMEKILERLGSGEPMAVILRTPNYPKYGTVYEWAKKSPNLASAIARARDCGFDAIAENLREVAREGNGSTGDVQRDKLIIETDLKLLSKWNPKKYGDRQIVDQNVTVTLADLVSQSYKTVEHVAAPPVLPGSSRPALPLSVEPSLSLQGVTALAKPKVDRVGDEE